MRDFMERAVRAGEDQVAIVAPGRQRRAGLRGDENGGVGMGGEAALGLGKEHMAVAQRQRRRAPMKAAAVTGAPASKATTFEVSEACDAAEGCDGA